MATDSVKSAASFERYAGGDVTASSLKEQSVRSAVGTALFSGADFFVRLGSTVILARLLVPEDFGLLAMITAVTAIAEELSSLGLSGAAVQARTLTKEQCSTLFWLNLAAGSAFAVAIGALAPAMASFYGEPRLTPMTIAVAVCFVFGGARVQHQALLARQLKQAQDTGVRLAANLLSAVVAIGLALGGYGYWALVWREVVRGLAITIGIWFLCPWVPGKPGRYVDVKALLGFGRDMALTQLLVSIIARLDGVLIGKFAGAIPLGLYKQAHGLMMAPLDQLQGPILSVSTPALSRLQDDPERYRRYYERILFAVSALTVPFGCFTVVYAREIVTTVLGPHWVDASPFLMVFGVAAAIRPSIATSGMVMFTCGHSGRYLVAACVHAIALVCAMAVGVAWGALGVAVASVATTVLILPWKLPYSFTGSPVTPGRFLSVTIKPLVAGAVMALILIWWRRLAIAPNLLFELMGAALLAAISYTVVLAITPGGWSLLRAGLGDVLMSVKR